MMQESRRSERHGYTVETRMDLAESDLDTHDVQIAELRRDGNKLMRILIGLLVSLTTASLLLAINLAVSSR